MPIAKKPKASKQKDEQEINAVINKGGSVAQAKANENQKILLRIPNKLLEKVDNSLASKTIKIPRNTWILEAISEKLGNEK